jgi:crotonobetainyl-CoA:carnitine CoA-transferase CaiB-like acyl-CoA transferase
MSQAHNDQPLAGVRIIDMTHDWAGPHATRVLADYGAEVIKIEYSKRLCGMRGAYLHRRNDHPRWWEINRNKAAITLDLHLPRDVAAVKNLVGTSDVVVDNSRPGVMERFGLGYDVLRRIRPDLIMVAMSAYGATGPESTYAGYGGAIEALSGVQELTAYEREGERMRIRELDVTNGVMGAVAIITALAARQVTGEGQFVDLAQREASTWLIGEHLLEYALNGSQTLPVGNRHPRFAPQGCYQCYGDDNWVVLTVRDEQEWRALCHLIGYDGWGSSPDFGTAGGRRARHDEIDQAIETWTRPLDTATVMEHLQQAGVPAGRVASTADLQDDPHLAARGWFETSADDGKAYPGFPFRFRNRPGGTLHRRGADLGADNWRILHGELGWPEDELPSLDPAGLGTAYDLE